MSEFYMLVLTPFALIFALIFLAYHSWRHPQRKSYKTIVELMLFLGLFLLGAFEILYGAFIGPACIISQARLLRKDVHLSGLTDEQIRMVEQHFHKLHDPWIVVTYFGVLTFVIGFVLLVLAKNRAKNDVMPNQSPSQSHVGAD